MSDMDRIFQKEDKTAFGGAQSHSLHQPQKKKKQIDIFLEEIKSRYLNQKQ
jgi:hypothetical protein